MYKTSLIPIIQYVCTRTTVQYAHTTLLTVLIVTHTQSTSLVCALLCIPIQVATLHALSTIKALYTYTLELQLTYTVNMKNTQTCDQICVLVVSKGVVLCSVCVFWSGEGEET